MKVLIIGSGGREHAIAWKIAQSIMVETVFVAPGNGGTALMGGKVRNIRLKATSEACLLQFAKDNDVSLTIVGPEQPLEDGIVDSFRTAGKKIIGPTKAAALLETSKVFAKQFMRDSGIPTADFEIFNTVDGAKQYVSRSDFKFPAAIKASGLCGGKGAIIVLSKEEALDAVDALMSDTFGTAGKEIVIEEFLHGQEASVFALVAEDGIAYKLFLPAQDHKRIGNDDTGKNTGGMGAYAPAPVVTSEVMRKVEERIIQPTLKEMANRKTPYSGFLYVGLMIDDDGNPSVVELNVRLGDPEAQVILPLLKRDLFEALWASVNGSLAETPWEMHKDLSATTVVLASGGYPDKFETGKMIVLDELNLKAPGIFLFHAGTKLLQDGKLETSGGRVFSLTAISGSLKNSIQRAYWAIKDDAVKFDGMYYRCDIGAKGLKEKTA